MSTAGENGEPDLGGVEDRLRAALSAEAERFSASPGAWEQAQDRARNHSFRDRRPPLRERSWRLRLPAPALAAAAVTIIIIAATFSVHRITMSPGPATPGPGSQPLESAAAVAPAGPQAASGPGQQLVTQYPPVGKIFTMAASTVSEAYFWIGYPSSTAWPDQITPGPLICGDAVSNLTSDSDGTCLAIPRLTAGKAAVVTASGPVDDGSQVVMGTASDQVASVMAVQPDGSVEQGQVGDISAPDGASGSVTVRVWAVDAPAADGASIIVQDAAGHQLQSLSTAAPAGPSVVRRPASGGVRMFGYNGGSTTAYLIDGYVGFWSGLWGGAISPVAVRGGPVVAGLVEPFGLVDTTGSFQYREVKAFGYAQAGVASVVLSLAGNDLVTVRTFAAGWPGSSVRLWSVTLPSGGSAGNDDIQGVTATAYSASGGLLAANSLGGGT